MLRVERWRSGGVEVQLVFGYDKKSRLKPAHEFILIHQPRRGLKLLPSAESDGIQSKLDCFYNFTYPFFITNIRSPLRS